MVHIYGKNRAVSFDKEFEVWYTVSIYVTQKVTVKR